MNTLKLILAGTLLTGAAQAAITQVANYQLGEAGSVGATAPYAPLQDSITTDAYGANNIASFNGGSTTALVTTGLSATGSTAAIAITNNTGGGTWYGSDFNGTAGLTDNWAFSLWVRPDNTAGTYLGATDGAAPGTGVVFHATNSSASGTSLGGKVLSNGTTYLRMFTATSGGFLANTTSAYTAGTWYKLGLVQYNGTLNYYINDVLQDSAVMGAKLDDIRLGAGYQASAGTNAAYDEMKVWTFDHTMDSLASVEAAMAAVPEPSTYGLMGAGALAGIALIRRRRKAA